MAEAAVIYGNYTMAVYLLSIPGGYIADAFLGARRSVLIGRLIIMCGHFSLALPMEATFYLGWCWWRIGSGLFKPNISAMVGGLYAAGDQRRDAGFSHLLSRHQRRGVHRAAGDRLSRAERGVQGFSEPRGGFDPAASWHLGSRRQASAWRSASSVCWRSGSG